VKFLLPLVLLVLAACQSKKEAANELRLSLASEISTIDPGVCFDQVCQQVVSNVYEAPYEYEYLKRPYQLRPLLAEGMPISEEGGRKVTIKLRKGVAYHPVAGLPEGRTVKAQDIVVAIKRQAFAPTRGQGWWLFEKRVVGLDAWRTKVGNDMEAFYREPVEGLTAHDDHTLVIRLVKPYPQLQFAFALQFTAPIPEEVLRASENDLGRAVVGTGAFKVAAYQPNQQVILERFAGYGGSLYPTSGDRVANEMGLLKDAGKKLPFLDRVVMNVQKEQQTSWLNFLAGKVDVLTLSKDYYQVALGPNGELTGELRGKKVNMQVAPTLIYWWLAFNMNDPVVGKNLKLRQAIAHAIDVEKFIKLFTSNVGQKANSIYPPGVPGYDPSAQLPYGYNPEKAKQLLAEAGHPGGKGLPELTFDVRGNATLNRQIAEFVAQELANVGIRAKTNMNSFPIFLERSRRGELQFWHGGWILDYPDAQNILQLLYSRNSPPGPNSTSYANKKVDALIDQLLLMEEGPGKHEVMAKIEQQVNTDLPWVMLYYTRNYVLTQSQVRNYRYSDMVGNYLKYVRVDSAP
jgi:oligopeptide transport system substrate-binding protein